MRDHNSLTEVIKANYSALLKDFSNLTGADFGLDLSRLKSFQDFREILSYLGKHEAILLHFLKTGNIVVDGCKNDGQKPVFLSHLWEGLTSCDPAIRTDSVRLLRQFFSLWKKAEVDVDPAPDLDKFVRRQKRPRVVSDPWLSVVDAAASVWKKYAVDLHGSELLPYTSSGAVAEKVPVLDRVEYIEDLAAIRHQSFLSHVPKVCSIPVNRAVAVPKDWTKVRVVFCEPSPRVQAQQSLRLWLETAVETSPLRRRINFQDQDFQRTSLRKEGRSSIDLSDASDYVTSALVWRFLRHTPVLRSCLFGARSRFSDVDGVVIPLQSYSTMGNATTFTVMSIFLACLLEVCESDVYRYSGRKPASGTVFGDDIVCDDFVAGTMLEYLRLVGLVPNGRKTFIGSAFRESCGLDLFEGTDVTPTAVKRWKSGSDDDIVAQVAYSNALWRKGLWHCAAHLSQRDDVPVNTTSSDDSYFSFTAGYDPRWSRWIAKEQRHVWDFEAPREPSYERDTECHYQYALVNGRLRAESPGSVGATRSP